MADEQEVKHEVRDLEVQRLIVTFSDGRKGIYSGPAIFSKAEMLLNPPRIVDVIITNPEPLKVKVPVVDGVKPAESTQETPNEPKAS